MTVTRGWCWMIVMVCVGTWASSASAQTVRSLPASSERFALVIGVGSYDDTNLTSLYSERDAAVFAGLLKDYAGFHSDNVVLLTTDQKQNDRRPTRQNILGRLHDAIVKTSTENGLLVVYFAGHGQSVTGDTVLFPSDMAYRAEESYLKEAGLRASAIAEALRNSKVKQVIVFVDACRDQLLTARGSDGSPTTAQFIESFNFEKVNDSVEAFATLFAAQRGGYSYEYQSQRMGYFTWEILQAFRGEAYDANNRLTLGALIRHLQRTVPQLVKKDVGKSQTPTYALSGYQANDLVLAGVEEIPTKNLAVLSGASVLIPPDGQRVYVANPKVGVVNVFDATTADQQRIIDLRPGRPEKMVLGNGELYITEPVSNRVAVVNIASGNVVASLPVGQNPRSLALTPDGHKLYVANQRPVPQGTISVIDPITRKSIRSISGINCPEDLAMSPDGERVYVVTQCGLGEDPIFVISTRSDTVINVLPGFAVGVNLGITRSGAKLYVSRGGPPEQVTVVRTATYESKTMEWPKSKTIPKFFAVTADDRFILCTSGSELLVIDTITDEVVKVTDLGSEAAGMAIGTAPGSSAPVLYVWLPGANQLLLTGLSGLLPVR